MKIDGISAIAIILIASFAIDRIVTGSLFLLSFVKYWTKYFPDPATLQPDARLAAERMLKLAYFGLSGFLGIPLFSGWYSKDAILANAFGFASVNPHHFLLFLVPMVTAGLTTFYMF